VAQAVKKILQRYKDCRISSRFWASTNLAKRTRLPWPAPARFRSSSRSPSMWPSNSQALRAKYVKSPTLAQLQGHFWKQIRRRSPESRLP